MFTNSLPTRSNARAGLWLGLLIPILLLQAGHYQFAFDVVSATAFLITASRDIQTTCLHYFLIYLPFVIMYSLYATLCWRFLFAVGFIGSATRSILVMYPGTFTFGEALLLVHLVLVFICSHVLFLIAFLFVFLLERYYSHRFARYMFTFLVFPIMASVILSHSFAISRIKFSYFFYCLNSIHFMLLLFWMCLFFICVLIVHIFGRYTAPLISPSQAANIHEGQAMVSDLVTDPSEFELDLKASSIQNHIQSKYHRAPFCIRKVFHFAAGLVFASGLLVSPPLLSVASTCLLAFFYLFEFIRRLGPPNLATYCNDLVNPFRDDRDAGALVFTPIALLLGLSVPVWWPLYQNQNPTIDLAVPCRTWLPSPHAWCGVLSIALGDSVAALIGRGWGVVQWPGSHRTLLGSFASWICQIILWLILAQYHSWPWKPGLLPISLGVLTEAYTDQIDNLVIPLIVMATFPLHMPK